MTMAVQQYSAGGRTKSQRVHIEVLLHGQTRFGNPQRGFLFLTAQQSRSVLFHGRKTAWLTEQEPAPTLHRLLQQMSVAPSLIPSLLQQTLGNQGSSTAN